MKKVFLLSLFYTCLIFIPKPSIAQIVYTNIDPDSTVNEFLHGYGVDFNHDDKIDVHLTLLDNVGVWVMLLIPDNNTDETFVVYDGEEASILENGDNISSSSNLYQLGSGWGGLLYGYWENDGEYGNWVDTQENKYLGIKFNINDHNYYGWIYLSTVIHNIDDMEFTIQSFAYNSMAEEGIIAGDMGQNVGLSFPPIKPFSIYPNPVQNSLIIDQTEGVQQIIITDIAGKQVFKSNNLNNNSIDTSSLTKGIYILSAQINGQVYKKKFIKD